MKCSESKSSQNDQTILTFRRINPRRLTEEIISTEDCSQVHVDLKGTELGLAKLGAGKYRHKECCNLVLEQPTYAQWICNRIKADIDGSYIDLNEQAWKWIIPAREALIRLISVFNRKAFVNETCHTVGCDRPVTRLAIYSESKQRLWFCRNCDPTRFSYPLENVIHICLFAEIVAYSKRVYPYIHDMNNMLAVEIVRKFAIAKGLSSSKERSYNEVHHFFYGKTLFNSSVKPSYSANNDLPAFWI